MTSISQRVVNSQGKEVGSIDLDPAVFDYAPSASLVHSAVVSQRNKRRAGTHSALTKAEVSGGGKKPWKQKGTGRARVGSNTSPLWVGGGVTHGPKPRDYSNRFSKRARQQALSEVLSAKRRADQLIVVDKFSFASGKTKDCAQALDKMGLGGAKVLLVLPSSGEIDKDQMKTIRACRNIAGLKVLYLDGLNVYDIVNHTYVIAAQETVQSVQRRLSGSPEAAVEKKASKKAAGKKSPAKKAAAKKKA